MQLSRWVYLADFVVYPLAATALAAAGLGAVAEPSAWLVASLVGLAVWTLVEYLLHRFVFHHVAVIERMHEEHHSNPRALVGSPFWLSLAIFVLGAFAPLWLCLGLGPASGLVAGLMVGYVWYALVHHAVHHWAIDERSWLYTAKMRHLRHHYRTPERNFGVTTGFWDYVFGTAPAPRRAKPELPV